VQSYHLPALARRRDVQILWVSDLDTTRASAVARQWGIPAALTDIEASPPETEAVVLAVPVGARAPLLERIAGRGWHALCEKPFARHEAEHLEFLRIGRSSGIRLYAGFVRRQYWAVECARSLLSVGLFGPLESVLACDCEEQHATGVRTDSYRNDAEAVGGGVLMETGIHLVDELVSITGAADAVVGDVAQMRTAGLEVETVAEATLLGCGAACDEKVPLSLVVSRVTEGYSGMCFRCRDAEIRILLTPDSDVAIHDHRGALVSSFHVPPDRTLIDAFEREWSEFIDGVRSPVIDYERATGLVATKVVAACYAGGQRRAPATM